jgi:predicted amidophosphoribosyltransferase
MASAPRTFPPKYPGPRPATCIHCGKKVRDDRERYCNHCGEDFWDAMTLRLGGEFADAAHEGRAILSGDPL